MRGAVVISWGNLVRGREKMDLEVFGKSIAYADELAKEGKIASHQEFLAPKIVLARRFRLVTTAFAVVLGVGSWPAP